MPLSRRVVTLFAALTLLSPAAWAQAPAAPTLPRPTSPSVPTRIGTPVAPSSGAAATAAAASAKIDVNAASEADLASLPGIGPVTAKAIVAGRPWDDLSALVSKKALSRPTFERNKDRLALANINTSSASDMAKTLPGIGDKTAPKIVDGRPYATPQDLVSKKVLTAAQFDRIKNLIAY